MKSINKIFNIGLNRCGTTSLTEAFNILGFKTLHFKYQDVRLHDIALNNMGLKRKIFYELDQQYNFFSDFAPYNFFHILDQQYPQSKFILTIRDLESWLDSRERKVIKNLSKDDYRYDFNKIDRKGWTLLREEFIDKVTLYFKTRPQDLLIINIPAGDGWHEICSFLDLPVPKIPFPHKNKLLT